jgi:hypothetical protein
MSDRLLSDEDQIHIKDALMIFTERWLVHGQPMRASFDIQKNHFVIIAADEQLNAASGCSIDDSVRVVKVLGDQLNIDFFDRSNVALLQDDQVMLYPLPFVKKQLQEKTLSGNTLTVNPIIQTKGDLEGKWISPLSSSWLARYLPQPSVSL